MELTETGFAPIPHSFLNALLVLGLTGRELRIILLISRFTIGFHKKWVKLKNKDFKIIGIGDGHIKEVMEDFLLKKIVIQNEKTKEYGLNIVYILSLANTHFPQRLEELDDLIHDQFKRKNYQNGNIIFTEIVGKDLPKEELPTYQNGNITPLPKREVLDSDNNDFSPLKDILKISKNTDKYEIANNSFKEGSQNAFT